MPTATATRRGAARLLILALLTLIPSTAAQTATSAPAPPDVAQDPRPRLAIAGFEPDPDGDPRDAWIPVAVEEWLAWRLQRVPGLIVAPTIRMYQARRELQDSPESPPPWPDVVRGLGLSYWLRGRCRGPENLVKLDLTLVRLDDVSGLPQEMSFPTCRAFEVLDHATRWVLERFQAGELPDAVQQAVFAAPSKSPSALEFYARAVTATRAEKANEALRHASQALVYDNRFRAALTLLAQVEAQMGPSGRGSAGRRLRALGDLAWAERDPWDRLRSDIGQSLLLQVDGATDAAYTRAESALAAAYELRDIYGQLAAITALCDLYLLRPMPLAPEVTPEARLRFARESAKRAADWQALEVEMLAALGDIIAGLPATNKLALIYERVEQPEQALAMHERTLALANKLNSRRHQATAWLYLGQWYRQQERWPEALDAMTRCLALADDLSKPAVRIALGTVYQAMQLHEEALAQFESAYEQVRRSDDLSNQFACLREIAAARMKLGAREKAITALREAIDLAHVLELSEEQRLREQLETWKQEGM